MLRIGPRSALAVGVVAGLLAVGTPAHAVANGSPAEGDRYGFVAKVEVGELLSCSGALIRPDTVLTAATCFPADLQQRTGAPKQPTNVTVGTPGSTKTLPVRWVVLDSGRSLALLELQNPVKDVQPISYGTPGADVVGTSVSFSGYGRTATEWAPLAPHNARFSVSAMTGTAPRRVVLDLAEDDEQRASLCKGDSGGPLYKEVGGKPFLIGLGATSWQHGCLGSTETRRGATAVAIDRTWIDESNVDAGWLIGKQSGLCLDVTGDPKVHGSRIVQADCKLGLPSQQWQFITKPGGSWVKNGNGFCLGVWGGKNERGYELVQWDCLDGHANQVWTFDGRFVNKQRLNTGQQACAGVKGGGAAPGDHIIQWNCDGTPNQTWYRPRIRPCPSIAAAAPCRPPVAPARLAEGE